MSRTQVVSEVFGEVDDLSASTDYFCGAVHERVSSLETVSQTGLVWRAPVTSYSKRCAIFLEVNGGSGTYRIIPDPDALHAWVGGSPSQPVDLANYEAQPIASDAPTLTFSSQLLLSDRLEPVHGDYVITSGQLEAAFFEGEEEADLRVWD